MRKILFVDHRFHMKTKSSDFFKEVLRRYFSLVEYHIDPERPIIDDLFYNVDNADIVILWQIDFLSPVFLTMGKPTIVVPMYDGSINMGDLHWLYSKQAKFINFSLTLHWRIKSLGCDSLLLRYYKEPVPEDRRCRFDSFDAFFWQRRPQDGLNINLVSNMIGSELDSLHLHDVPDSPEGSAIDYKSLKLPSPLKISKWFGDVADFEAAFESCNVFVAPRPTEGIGMSLLEAMARGMVIFANDEPTHNEYISNWSNGILFNRLQPPANVMFRSAAKDLGYMAWKSAVDGYEKWLAAEESIVAWILSAEAPRCLDDRPTDLLSHLLENFYSSHQRYENWLLQNVSNVASLSDIAIEEIVDRVGEAYLEAPQTTQTTAPKSVGILDEKGRFDICREDTDGLWSGWSAAEPEFRWIEGMSAELGFDGSVVTDKFTHCRTRVHALKDIGDSLHLIIRMNGVRVVDSHIDEKWQELVWPIPKGGLKDLNVLSFVVDKAQRPKNGDRRMLSLCVRPIECINMSPKAGADEEPEVGTPADPARPLVEANPVKSAPAALRPVISPDPLRELVLGRAPEAGLAVRPTGDPLRPAAAPPAANDRGRHPV